ncbi:MAG: methionine--tRNA ligase subunit beta [Actinobacteria bacterium]|nr:methionine--tRNA ligase subunit beta [Actinomycetota bacterium]
MKNPGGKITVCENKPTISYEDFCKLDLRVAKVIEAENHPNADKLICMKIDLGNEQRQIIAGLRGYYEPAELIGKEIVVVANLAPRKMRGLESHGMLLAASDESEGEKSLVILTTERPIGAGAEVS